MTIRKGSENILGLAIDFLIFCGNKRASPHTKETLVSNIAKIKKLIQRYTELDLIALAKKMEAELKLLEYYTDSSPEALEQCGATISPENFSLFLRKVDYCFIRGFSSSLGDDMGVAAKMSLMVDFKPIVLNFTNDDKFKIPMLPFGSFDDMHIPEIICSLIKALEKNAFVYRLFMFHLAKSEEIILATYCADDKMRVVAQWGQSPLSSQFNFKT